MQIIDRLSENGASEPQLQGFEEKIESRLPQEYRQFLKIENGGRPARVNLVFETGDGTSDSLVSWFYTLEPDRDYGLLENIECYNNRVPSDMIPIACDPFGNQFLMELGDEQGAIYFWDHELENEHANENDNVYKIADSFSSFAKMFP